MSLDISPEMAQSIREYVSTEGNIVFIKFIEPGTHKFFRFKKNTDLIKIDHAIREIMPNVNSDGVNNNSHQNSSLNNNIQINNNAHLINTSMRNNNIINNIARPSNNASSSGQMIISP